MIERTKKMLKLDFFDFIFLFLLYLPPIVSLRILNISLERRLNLTIIPMKILSAIFILALILYVAVHIISYVVRKFLNFKMNRRIARKLKKKNCIKVHAFICPKCGDKVYSRTMQDCRSCSCGEISVDGGFDYSWAESKNEVPEEIEIEISTTKEDLYNDWDLKEEKFGIIKKKI